MHQGYTISFTFGANQSDLAACVPDSQYTSHALHFRQAKLAFPNVYLLVGVSSDEDVSAYKGRCVMTYLERFVIIRRGLLYR